MNRVILIGNLTKDPELSTTNSGISVCKFTLAVQRRFSGENGTKEADFLPIIVWRSQAENCAKYLRKGSKCGVVGSVMTRNYDDKDGVKRYVTEIVADECEFLSLKQETDEPQSQSKQEKQETIATLMPVDDDSLPF